VVCNDTPARSVDYLDSKNQRFKFNLVAGSLPDWLFFPWAMGGEENIREGLFKEKNQSSFKYTP
jgi:hypothetical protein